MPDRNVSKRDLGSPNRLVSAPRPPYPSDMASISLPDILRLSVPERLRLVGEIWDSIAAEPEALPLTPAQRREILRRSEAHRANPQEAAPLDEALHRIGARLFVEATNVMVGSKARGG